MLGDVLENARAHPRSRGENVEVHAFFLLLRGSSPLTRGKRIQRPRPPHEGGSSPLTRGKLDQDVACLAR